MRVYDAVSLQLGPASFSFGVSAFHVLKRFLYYRAVLCLTLIRWDFVSGAVEQFWPDVVFVVPLIVSLAIKLGYPRWEGSSFFH